MVYEQSATFTNALFTLSKTTESWPWISLLKKLEFILIKWTRRWFFYFIFIFRLNIFFLQLLFFSVSVAVCNGQNFSIFVFLCALDPQIELNYRILNKPLSGCLVRVLCRFFCQIWKVPFRKKNYDDLHFPRRRALLNLLLTVRDVLKIRMKRVKLPFFLHFKMFHRLFNITFFI